jgi:hypothetical protein
LGRKRQMMYYVNINIVDMDQSDKTYSITIDTNLPDIETVTKVVSDTLATLENVELEEEI